jgi:5-hydroxyisourate hydrolase
MQTSFRIFRKHLSPGHGVAQGYKLRQSDANAGGLRMAGWLTTHVLDTARGCPAEGLRIVLSRIGPQGAETLADMVTNADGRTDAHILPKETFATGTYELVFHAGDYLRASGQAGDDPLFLDQVPIRFGMADATAHYHVPLLLSPYGYSTYRGS